VAKRAFDVIAATLGLLLSLPLLALVAGAVLMADGYPVLFRQARVGLCGRDFALLKFRTMSVRQGAEHGSFDAGSAARITRLGGLLRRAKLDELPQLWNVLKGQMSMVGPRPEVRRWVDAYPTRWAGVLAVRPGITDPASIEYRNEEQLLAASPDPETKYREEILPRKLDLYEQYVRERSFAGDLHILLKTIAAVIRGLR
jgi:lipopolysaccharide/colanic/teichoic acid biosynthesis glycosyltransferase